MPSGQHVVGAQEVLTAGSQDRWDSSGPYQLSWFQHHCLMFATPPGGEGRKGEFDDYLNDRIAKVILRANFEEKRASCA